MTSYSHTVHLLEHWQAPPEAGAPVAALACTFALDPDFFETDLLARFLGVTTVNEGNDPTADIIADVEMAELIRGKAISVLADRSMGGERTSLAWDLLQCSVPGGLFHPKTTVLLWEHATRILIGSANLTEAGYRRQIELVLAADLGPGGLLPLDVLRSYVDELESYLGLIPTALQESSASARARSTLALLRGRIEESAPRRSPVLVALATSRPGSSPLNGWTDVWRGRKPTAARHLSPFWDRDDSTVIDSTAALLTGHGPKRQDLVTVATPRGTIPVPEDLRSRALPLAQSDAEVRLLHAKCLLLSSKDWTAALVGSSNHTIQGLGLSARPHRELNLWLGDDAHSKVSWALGKLVEESGTFAEETEVGSPVGLDDNEDAQRRVVPLGFQACVLKRSSNGPGWQLIFDLEEHHLPEDWTIVCGGTSILQAEGWRGMGRPTTLAIALPEDEIPSYVVVYWPECLDGLAWPVLADNLRDLPPKIGVEQLSAELILYSLRARMTVARAKAEMGRGDRKDEGGTRELDPLRRHQDVSRLLREGRRLAKAIEQLQALMTRPVLTLEQLQGRLGGLQGPNFLFRRLGDDVIANRRSPDEAVFAMAEIMLGIGRAPWADAAGARISLAVIVDVVGGELDVLLPLVTCIDGGTPAIRQYARAAWEEAQTCLRS